MRLRPAPEESSGGTAAAAGRGAPSTRHLGARELVNELVVGGAFAIAAVALAVARGGSEERAADALVLVLVGLVLALRVVFQVGSCYTMPIQIAFVPALFVRPAGVAPLLVAAALVAPGARSTSPGELRPVAPANALARLLVLARAGGGARARRQPGRGAVGAGVLVAALAAQFARRRARLAGARGAPRRAPRWRAAQPERLDLLRRRPALADRLRDRARRVDRARGDHPRLAAVRCCSRLFARERDERLRSRGRAQRGLPRHRPGARGGGRARRRLHRRSTSAASPSSRRGRRRPRPRRRSSGAWSSSGRSCTTSARSRSRRRSSRSPARSTRIEWEVIRTHTIEGQRMLAGIGGLMRDVGEDRALLARALRRRRLPRRAGRPTRSRSRRGSCSAATPTTR